MLVVLHIERYPMDYLTLPVTSYAHYRPERTASSHQIKLSTGCINRKLWGRNQASGAYAGDTIIVLIIVMIIFTLSYLNYWERVLKASRAARVPRDATIESRSSI